MTNVDTPQAEQKKAPVLQPPNTGKKTAASPFDDMRQNPAPKPIGIQIGGQNPFLATGVQSGTSGADPMQMFTSPKQRQDAGQPNSVQQPLGLDTAPLSTGGSAAQLLQATQLFKQDAKVPDKADESIELDTAEEPEEKQDGNSFFETKTEDDRLDGEIRAARRRAAAIAAPERKAAELKAVQQREEARKNWLERRSIAEQGAELFVIPKLRNEYLKGGWCQLFDGQTSFGWQIQNNGHYAGGQFAFENGEIKSDPYHPGLLFTKAQFGNLTLRFDYKADADAEVMLLLKTPPNPNDLYSSCYSIILQSATRNRFCGLILGRQDYSINTEPSRQDGGEWRSVTVQVDNSQLQFWIDRQNPVTYIDAKPIRYGHIGFLVAKGRASFRNILWKPSAPIRLFDADNDLQKTWRPLPKELQFADSAAEPGHYRMSGGPGVVETLETFGNFVLQLEYYSGITSSRSGLFVRSRPGEAETGYEVSLQNFPTRQDRESSVGVDAGSFRGIKDARYVRATDGIWNYLTLSVTDRHCQTWINGVPVCEITDNRRKKEHSTAGPFLEPGTLQFFAPQAGTSVQFRNLKISAY
ncbi:MAG: DUF1080 domain-containing protein [Planctomycetaceae bacterium]|jgi:hypothetical protein|nr:DUF1080 domain-containing protein [Planctomycetaceae bacterium]